MTAASAFWVSVPFVIAGAIAAVVLALAVALALCGAAAAGDQHIAATRSGAPARDDWHPWTPQPLRDEDLAADFDWPAA